MKTNKRTLAMLTAGLLAITPMAATGMTAFASNLTIDNVTGDTSTHAYSAYAIITGTKTGDALTDMNWGNGVDSANLIAALKTFDNTTFGTLAADASAKDVAALLAGYTNPEGLAKVFNTTGVLNTANAVPVTQAAAGGAYSATGLANGWYFVKDDIATTGSNVRSANLLQIVGDTTVTPKYSLPTLQKKILEDRDNDTVNERYDANNTSIGDLVNYELATEVPDMTGYNKYFFVINDTLSDGLTFNASSVAVTLNGIDLVNGTDYEVQTGADAVAGGVAYTFQIVFKNFISRKNDAGKDIVVTYNATLDNDAVITNAGNPNTANLVYSNDPNCSYTGGTAGNPDGPDEPSGGDVTGETPDQTVTTFTTAIKITKIDQDNRPLKGAKFKLEGTSVNTVLVSGATFAESATGDYWKLKNGSYTTTDPAGITNADDIYDSTTQKYAKTETSNPQTKTATVDVEAYVDDSGILTFTGLGAGVYTLTETSPAGYNSIAPMTVTIDTSAAPAINNPNWVVKAGESATLSSNTYNVSIQNVKGSTLPTTGGIGTKLFYIIGSLLVAGSVVILVTRKRMGANE